MSLQYTLRSEPNLIALCHQHTVYLFYSCSPKHDWIQATNVCVPNSLVFDFVWFALAIFCHSKFVHFLLLQVAICNRIMVFVWFFSSSATVERASKGTEQEQRINEYKKYTYRSKVNSIWGEDAWIVTRMGLAFPQLSIGTSINLWEPTKETENIFKNRVKWREKMKMKMGRRIKKLLCVCVCVCVRVYHIIIYTNPWQKKKMDNFKLEMENEKNEAKQSEPKRQQLLHIKQNVCIFSCCLMKYFDSNLSWFFFTSFNNNFWMLFELNEIKLWICVEQIGKRVVVREGVEGQNKSRIKI